MRKNCSTILPHRGHQQQDKISLVAFRRIQTMKAIANGAMPIKKGATELHVLLLRCEDHPELVDDDAAKAEVTADELLLLLLLELKLVVVPVGGEAVVPSAVAVEVLPVKAGVVTGPVAERDEESADELATELEDADGDETLMPEEILVMAKEGLVSPESPSTRAQLSRFSR
jgi:hypothetical protein